MAAAQPDALFMRCLSEKTDTAGDLAVPPSGDDEPIALPLKLTMTDAFPVRALLRER